MKGMRRGTESDGGIGKEGTTIEIRKFNEKMDREFMELKIDNARLRAELAEYKGKSPEMFLTVIREKNAVIEKKDKLLSKAREALDECEDGICGEFGDRATDVNFPKLRPILSRLKDYGK